MLFTRHFKEQIRAGRVTRTYRIWKRPQAKVGGRYNLAPDGTIEVTAIDRVVLARVGDDDARAAGFADAGRLIAFLGQPIEATAYQVDFTYLGPGLVNQPERGRSDSGTLATLQGKLEAMDRRADAPWTDTVLRLIARHPGTRAGDLAPSLGWDTPTFKRQVTKLKALGLTHSLETGYRLSDRGRQLLEQ